MKTVIINPHSTSAVRHARLLFFTLWLGLVAYLAVGCKATTFEYQGIKATDRRTFLRSEADILIVTTNGTRIDIKAKSDPSTEAIKAAAAGVAEGLMKGAGKAVVP
jgi:hypothetical protein